MNGITSKGKKCRHAVVRVLISGKPCLALADAGATITLIRADIATRLKLPIHQHKISATGVTNDTLKIIGMTAAKITLGGEVYTHCLHIADQISHEVILGTDFLAKLGEVAYNFDKCLLKIGNTDVPMGDRAVIPRDAKICIHKGNKHAVRMVDHMRLPPFSQTLIDIPVEHDFKEGRLCLFEGNQLATSRSLLIGRSVDRVNTGMIRFPILNTSSSFQIMPVNAIVGSVESLEEDLHLLRDKPVVQSDSRPGDSLKMENTDLNQNQIRQMRALINEFQDTIAEGITELGRTSIVEHVIETVPGATPVRSRPYNIPVHLRAEVKDQIDKMMEQGLISMSTGAWSSPIVLVKKKDGTWRFCVDYRKLNAVTVKHSMALTNIDNAMEIMHGKRYFSSIDLCSGFHQVSLHEDSKEKSSFITPFGTYRWNVMPQGASGSPSTFQRLALAIMADLITEGSSCVYLDDWLMTSRTFDKHLELLRTVFSRLRFAGLKYRLSKSTFCQRELTYLGHVISAKGIAVAPHNTEKISKFKAPTDKTGVKRLLGLFSFYRTYIKGFSSIAAPLIHLTKDVPFVWTEECQHAMEVLKERITSAPILSFPDFSRPFVLTTDASATAVGAVLSQVGEDGKSHPVSFYSRALKAPERKWDACEQELFAILCAVKHYRAFLMNTHFKVQTDNVACTYIVKKSDFTPRLARWAVQLADYSFDIEHKAGKENLVADALSRSDEVNVIDEDLDENDKDMSLAQSRDYYLSPIMLYLSKRKFPPDASKRERTVIMEKSSGFELVNGVLYKARDGQRLLAIPANQRKDLLFAAHESLMSIHPGVSKTLLKLRSKYWFPNMNKEVRRHISQCESCQRKKDPKTPIRVPMKYQMADSPFDVLSVDFQGPFVESDSGMKHILVWTDHFTKYTELEACRDQAAMTVARSYIERIFCRFGCSRVLLSDRAKNFLSEVVTEINSLLRVDHRKTTPYRPQTNGLTEVTNRTIGQMLSHLVAENHKDWDTYLPFVQMAHNSARHTVINASPSMLLFCREMRMPYDMTQPKLPERVSPGTYAAELHERMATVWEHARQAMEKGKINQKKYYDKKATPSTLQVGDAVLYYNRRGYRNRTSKLIKRWQGIYIVKKMTENYADIQLFDEPDQKPFRVNLNTLKRYHGPAVRGSSHELDIDLGYSPDDESDTSDDAGAESDTSDREGNSSRSGGKPEVSYSSDGTRRPENDKSAGNTSVVSDGNKRNRAEHLTVSGDSVSPQGNDSEVPVDDNSQINRKQPPPEPEQRTRKDADGRYALRRRVKRKRDADFLYTSS